jgi:hypothetical protein
MSSLSYVYVTSVCVRDDSESWNGPTFTDAYRAQAFCALVCRAGYNNYTCKVTKLAVNGDWREEVLRINDSVELGTLGSNGQDLLDQLANALRAKESAVDPVEELLESAVPE